MDHSTTLPLLAHGSHLICHRNRGIGGSLFLTWQILTGRRLTPTEIPTACQTHKQMGFAYSDAQRQAMDGALQTAPLPCTPCQ